MDDIEAAIRAATYSQLDEIVRRLTAAWAKGEVDDESYTAAYGLAHRRRADLKARAEASASSPSRRGVFPSRPSQRPPDRQRSIERRRRLAASGPLPPRLAARFTTAEAAVLRIVADEVREHGACDRSLDEIAARAGVSRSSCRNALRQAQHLGLLTIEVRPRPGRRNDTNVLRIVSAEWRAWIERGPKPIGRKNVTSTATKVQKGFEQEPWRDHGSRQIRDSGSDSRRHRDSREALRKPSRTRTASG